MTNAHEVIEELRSPTRSLRKAAPEAWAGFSHLHDAAVADGVLPARIKELMALAHRGRETMRRLHGLPRQVGRSAGGHAGRGRRGSVGGTPHGRWDHDRLRAPCMGGVRRVHRLRLGDELRGVTFRSAFGLSRRGQASIERSAAAV